MTLRSLFSRKEKGQKRLCGCGRPTRQRLIVDAKTLRRRYIEICDSCFEERFEPQQKRLRELRTKKDWDEVTDPVNGAAIRPDEMPEQYPGRPRDAIRAFLASGSARAIVPGVDPATIQTTIAALGLTSEVYAEQRDDRTVLRRIEAKERV